MNALQFFFFHRLLKIKEVHAKRREAKDQDEIEGLADAVHKFPDKELWENVPTATEYVEHHAADIAERSE